MHPIIVSKQGRKGSQIRRKKGKRDMREKDIESLCVLKERERLKKKKRETGRNREGEK